MKHRFGRLFFAIDQIALAKELLDVDNVTDLFYLPLSEQAFAELHVLKDLMSSL